MATTLSFAALARGDLLEITRYIARDNPARARSFVAELRERCALLEQHPGMGVARPKYGDGLYMLAYARYLIFFSTNSHGILIERVLHSARDLHVLFNQGGDD